MSESTSRVVVGMDPRERSVTIEVMDTDETLLDGGRFGTDEAGFTAIVLLCDRRTYQKSSRRCGSSGAPRRRTDFWYVRG